MIARLIVKTTSLFLLVALLFSCSDDIPNVGGDMMPDGDKIDMFAEQVYITAKTVSIDSDLFLRSNSAILGSIEDPLLGTTKSDFMGQLFVANPSFKYGYKGLDDVAIDSVRMIMVYPYTSFTGDFQAPMGVTVYALNEQLTENFYMSVDPATYCNRDTIMGYRFFTQNELPLTYSSSASTYFRTLEIDLDQNIGQKIYDQWKSDTLSGKPKKETVLYDTNTFKEFMKGIYVTTTFNNKSMINFSDINASLYMNIYYSYNVRNTAGTADSLLSGNVIPFPIGAEALHLNSVQSTKYEDMAIYNSTDTDRTYIKALSGVVTEVTIPLKEIREKGKSVANTEAFTLNSALLNFVGMTEKEKDLKFTDRPSRLLFVNADSISNYFLDGKKPNGLTSQVLTRTSSNTYYFNSGLSASTTTSNFAVLINQYLQNNPQLDEVKYYLIPIDVTTESSYYNGYTTYIISGVSNSYVPSAAILRTSKEYLKVPLLFSKFATNK